MNVSCASFSCSSNSTFFSVWCLSECVLFYSFIFYCAIFKTEFIYFRVDFYHVHESYAEMSTTIRTFAIESAAFFREQETDLEVECERRKFKRKLELLNGFHGHVLILAPLQQTNGHNRH